MEKKIQPYKITTSTGLALEIANMIGTGAFTCLGFQLVDLKNPTSILILWVLGGVIALEGSTLIACWYRSLWITCLSIGYISGLRGNLTGKCLPARSMTCL